jgi:hypothetical protein
MHLFPFVQTGKYETGGAAGGVNGTSSKHDANSHASCNAVAILAMEYRSSTGVYWCFLPTCASTPCGNTSHNPATMATSSVGIFRGWTSVDIWAEIGVPSRHLEQEGVGRWGPGALAYLPPLLFLTLVGHTAWLLLPPICKVIPYVRGGKLKDPHSSTKTHGVKKGQLSYHVGSDPD